jgi:hypothetical protein
VSALLKARMRRDRLAREVAGIRGGDDVIVDHACRFKEGFQGQLKSLSHYCVERRLFTSCDVIEKFREAVFAVHALEVHECSYECCPICYGERHPLPEINLEEAA